MERMLMELLATHVAGGQDAARTDDGLLEALDSRHGLDALERRNAQDPALRVRSFERTLRERFEGRSATRYMLECTDMPYNRLIASMFFLTAQAYEASKSDVTKAQNLMVSTMMFLEQAALDGGKVNFAYNLTLAPELPPAPEASHKPKRDRSGRAAFAKLAEQKTISAALGQVKEWAKLAETRGKLE